MVCPSFFLYDPAYYQSAKNPRRKSRFGDQNMLCMWIQCYIDYSDWGAILIGQIIDRNCNVSGWIGSSTRKIVNNKQSNSTSRGKILRKVMYLSSKVDHQKKIAK